MAGASAHYDDPSYYCRTYKSRLADVVFYTDRAARARRVLELGCGNGRITLPIARSGIEIVGVDLSEVMIRDLEARLLDEPEDVRARVELRVADMRRFKLRGVFDLVICPFNAFLHLYSRKDVEGFLACVRRALAPRGTLAFDVSIPDPAELARKPERLYRTRPFVYPGVGKVRYGERFDYDPIAQVLHVSMEFEPLEGEAFTTPLTHRQFHPQELEALLHYNGFQIVELLGDFEGPPSETTQSLVIVAKPRR
jgi:SAM-dependent methyltransferase